VIAGRLKDGHLEGGPQALQARCHGEAGGTTADDQDLVMGHGQRNREDAHLLI
jgi:hypothetical protein